MIFQKRAKRCTEYSFHIDNENIEVVQNYTYLGTLISSTGNFSLALDKLKEKALHALLSCGVTSIQQIDFQQLNYIALSNSDSGYFVVCL